MLRWCRAQDLFGSEIPMTTGGFALRISGIQSNYLTNSKLKYLNIDQLLNVTLKASYCEICRNLKGKNEMGTISLVQ